MSREWDRFVFHGTLIIRWFYILRKMNEEKLLYSSEDVEVLLRPIIRNLRY